MFCEKCGHSNTNSARFCEKCGAPMSGDVTQLASSPDETPVTRVWTPDAKPDTWQPPERSWESPEQQWQPPEADPLHLVDDGYEQYYRQKYPSHPDNGYDAAYPPEYPPEYEDQYQPQPEDPQKGTNKKTKRIILFSAIGASVLAVVLILLFAVILPAVNRSNPTDISRYYTIKFAGVDEGVPEQSLSDGKISCWFAWDYQQFALDSQMPKSKAKNLLDDVDSFVQKQYILNGEVAYFSSFDNLKTADTIKVSFIWPTGEAEKNLVEKCEKTYGVRFLHDYSTREYNIGDALRQKNITIKQPADVDLLRYIADNGLFVEEVKSDGKVSVSIASFETKINGYTFTMNKGSLSVLVLDDKDFKIGRFDLEMSNSVNLRGGDVVTLKYDSYARRNMLDKGVVLQGDSVTYTVKTPAATTVPTTVAPTTVPPATEPPTTVPVTEAPTEAPTEEQTEAPETTFSPQS